MTYDVVWFSVTYDDNKLIDGIFKEKELEMR